MMPDENETMAAGSGTSEAADPSAWERRRNRRRKTAEPPLSESQKAASKQARADLHEAITAARREALDEAGSVRTSTAAQDSAPAGNDEAFGGDTAATHDPAFPADDADQTSAEAASEDIPADVLLGEQVLHNSKVPPNIGAASYFRAMKYEETPATVETESAYIMDIASDYDWKINVGGTFFVNSGSAIFNKEFDKVMRSYVQLERGEFPLLIYDSTLRNSGGYGFTITSRYFHFHTRDFVPYKIRLKRIQRVVVDFGETVSDWTVLRIRQRGSKYLIPTVRSINAERIIEIADVLLHIVYRNTPECTAALTVNGAIPRRYSDDSSDRSFRHLFSYITGLIFRKKPGYDIPGQEWTPEYHVSRLNAARISLGMDPVSRKYQQNGGPARNIKKGEKK